MQWELYKTLQAIVRFIQNWFLKVLRNKLVLIIVEFIRWQGAGKQMNSGKVPTLSGMWVRSKFF